MWLWNSKKSAFVTIRWAWQDKTDNFYFMDEQRENRQSRTAMFLMEFIPFQVTCIWSTRHLRLNNTFHENVLLILPNRLWLATIACTKCLFLCCQLLFSQFIWTKKKNRIIFLPFDTSCTRKAGASNKDHCHKTSMLLTSTYSAHITFPDDCRSTMWSLGSRANFC